MKSDYLDVEVRESTIPQSGMGVFARNPIKQGQLIVEYRGYLIDSKDSYDVCFKFEDKMIEINEKYSVIGRGLASRINDSVKLDKLNEDDHEMINQGQFPMLYHAHNVEAYVNRDKIFLRATRNIQPQEELFLSYGYAYWKWFYDLRNQLPDFNYQQQKYWSEDVPQQKLIDHSEHLKLDYTADVVIAKKKIAYNEWISECRGKLYQAQQPVRTNLPLNDLYLQVNKKCQKLLNSKSNDYNAELIKVDNKYFIQAIYPIHVNQQISVRM